MKEIVAVVVSKDGHCGLKIGIAGEKLVGIGRGGQPTGQQGRCYIVQRRLVQLKGK
jgi:hypothetical protein